MYYKIYIITYLMHIGIIGRFRYERKRYHYLTGKTAIIKVFGEEPWNSFIPKLAQRTNFSAIQFGHYSRSDG